MKASCPTVVVLLFASLVAGCKPRKHGVDWTCENLSFSNQVVELYWRGSTWRDSSGFGHRLAGRVTKGRTGDYFFLSTLNLETLTCVERFLSEDELKRVVLLKQECIRQFSTERISDDAKVLDANCDGDFMVLKPDLGSMPVIVHGGISNKLPYLRSLINMSCVINERGDFFSISLFAGMDRKNQPQVPFQLLRNGQWWISYLPGMMPALSDTNLVRTSTFPALVETFPQ